MPVITDPESLAAVSPGRKLSTRHRHCDRLESAERLASHRVPGAASKFRVSGPASHCLGSEPGGSRS
eukprot:114660-Hanusia_phi.AAC.1